MSPWPWAVAALLLDAAVAVLALRAVKTRPYHRPAARYLAAVAVADAGQTAIVQALLHVQPPYAGLARVSFHLDEALYLVGPLGVGWLALAVYWPARRGARERYLSLALFLLGVLVVGYPRIRGELLGSVYLGASLASLAVAAGAVWTWRRAFPREWPAFTHLIVLLLAVGEGLLVVGPSAADIFGDWRVRWGIVATVQGAIAVLHLLWAGAAPGGGIRPARLPLLPPSIP